VEFQPATGQDGGIQLKKYFDNLRPSERRLVVIVAVVVVVALNWVYVWPHFADFGNYENRLDSATRKLSSYNSMIAQTSTLQNELKTYEGQGIFVAPDDQGVTFLRTVQTEALGCSVALQSSSRPTTRTNDVFFVEVIQNINVLAEEKNLVDFLYKLGSDSSMIRVRDLALQPDAPHQRLSADIRLVANYQKTPAGTAAKTQTAMAK
jgi:Tfp pilus assembly protein PilO